MMELMARHATPKLIAMNHILILFISYYDIRHPHVSNALFFVLLSAWHPPDHLVRSRLFSVVPITNRTPYLLVLSWLLGALPAT